jgi:hypothetical protein
MAAFPPWNRTASNSSCIPAFALRSGSALISKPPRTRDTSITDAYYNSVADAVVRQIKLSGWELRPFQTLEKKPPREPHSTT